MGAGEACLAPTWDGNSVGATHASPAFEAVKPASQVEGRVQLDGPLVCGSEPMETGRDTSRWWRSSATFPPMKLPVELIQFMLQARRV